MSRRQITVQERSIAVILSEMLNNAIRAQSKAKAVRAAEAVLLLFG
jgi:hypothetical protein